MPGPVTTGLCVLAAAAASLRLPLRWLAAVALVSWAFVTGFGHNDHGRLTLEEPDLLRLTLMATTIPALALLAGAVRRRASIVRGRARPTSRWEGV